MDSLEDVYVGHKVLVIGPFYAGKTCYVQRIVEGTYDTKEFYKKTMGGRLISNIIFRLSHSAASSFNLMFLFCFLSEIKSYYM